jgi:hypothetical protein
MPFSDFGRRKVLAVFDGDVSGGMYVQDDPQSETLLYRSVSSFLVAGARLVSALRAPPATASGLRKELWQTGIGLFAQSSSAPPTTKSKRDPL